MARQVHNTRRGGSVWVPSALRSGGGRLWVAEALQSHGLLQGSAKHGQQWPSGQGSTAAPDGFRSDFPVGAAFKVVPSPPPCSSGAPSVAAFSTSIMRDKGYTVLRYQLFPNSDVPCGGRGLFLPSICSNYHCCVLSLTWCMHHL